MRNRLSWLASGALVAAAAVVVRPSTGAEPDAVVNEGAWAVQLARALGHSGELSASDAIALLGQHRPIHINARRFRERLGSITEVHVGGEGVDTTIWMEQGEESGTLFYELRVGRPGKYLLSAYARGGAQIWTVGGQSSRLMDVTKDEGIYQMGPLTLPAGRATLTVSLTKGSAVESFELAPPFGSPVRPTRGWRVRQPLNYGVKAQTMVRALGLEYRLPERPKEEFLLMRPGSEARIDEAGWAWVNLYIPEGGIYTIGAWFDGPAPDSVLVDGRYSNVDQRLRPLDTAGSPDPEPLHLGTGLMREGRHTLAFRLPPGSELQAVRVARKNARAEAYLDLLVDYVSKHAPGAEGADPRLSAFVTQEIADQNVKLLQDALQRQLGSPEYALGKKSDPPPKDESWAFPPVPTPPPYTVLDGD